jgi:predicted Rossmann fold nucleotide-binding protein DprA/Smf involved in DNA uptake
VIEDLAPQLTNAAPSAPPLASAAPARPAPPSNQRNLQDNREKQFQTVLEHLSASERIHVDSIVESSGLNAQTVLGVLLELELNGVVAQHPGKLFSLAQI